MTTLHAYNGRKIRVNAEVEQTLVHVLRVLASRDRDDTLVNIRTFQAKELTRRGLRIPFKELQEAFSALAEASVCKLTEGSMNRLERAQFKESARQVAQKILGVHKILASEHMVLGTGSVPSGGDKTLEAARKVLKADVPDSVKVKLLSAILLKE
jgi:hypothetical protein